jgi:putative ABC transport system permease protein
MGTWLQDVRYAFVTMRRNPGFTAAVLLTLALGIGATTAVFSIVDGVLLRPLPYPEPNRLVRLSEEHPGAVSPLRDPLLSNLTYYAWSQAPRTVESLATYTEREYTAALPSGPVRIQATAVTPSLFALVGEAPALGRFFRADDAVTGADAIVVLTDRVWHEYFGGDPTIIGRGLALDGKPHTIVGVARPEFSFPDRSTRIWTPYVVTPPAQDAAAGGRGAMGVMNAIGRLKPGMTAQQAEAEGTAAARSMIRPMAANLLFGEGGPVVVHVRSMLSDMTATIRPALLVLAAGVAVVLLIACANVANLFLSRGVARQRELALRAAIGASGGRLARQLFTESVAFSVLGGMLGLGLAYALVRIAPAIAAENFPRFDDVRVDARVMAFAALAAAFTAVASGLVPALRGARFDLSASLHGGDGATAGGFRGLRAQRLRDGLLVAEAAFAVMLLVSAILLARSFVRLTNVDAGYTASNVLAAQVFVPGYDAAQALAPDGAAKVAHIAALVDTVLQRARSTPGVRAAGAASMMPLDNTMAISGFPAPWAPPGAQPVSVRALQYTITPGYIEALRLRLKSGRGFTDADASSGVRSWIVNEEFARQYLPPNPVGYRFTQQPASGPVQIEVVGVVGNVLKSGNDSKPQAEYYRVARDRSPFSGRFGLAIRTAANPAALAPIIRGLVSELEPDAAVETVPLSQRVSESVAQPRFAMIVLLTFAVLALALAAVGLYGVLSYGVSQRRRELGVRAALGAAKGDLVQLVVREGLTVTAFGLVIGLCGAAAGTRLMQSVLFGIGPLDAVSFLLAPKLLVPVAALACMLPAMRAAVVDPSVALRCE